ncbi:alpha-L-fucosidase [Micrococcales bacterium 31B]|nr:alpha-L-fucosidase [Micrococcales bacterium 31B]
MNPRAAARPLLDLSFGGTFHHDHQYTAAGTEVLVGSAARHGGRETNPFGRGLVLGGGRDGFTARLTSPAPLTEGRLDLVVTAGEPGAGLLAEVPGLARLAVDATGALALTLLGHPVAQAEPTRLAPGVPLTLTLTWQPGAPGETLVAAAGAQSRGTWAPPTELTVTLGGHGPDAGWAGCVGSVRLAPSAAAPGASPPESQLAAAPLDAAALLRAASAARPSANQVDYLAEQRLAFFHFGVNTCNAARDYPEWGHGDEDPAIVNPQRLDTDQWIRSVADAGFNAAIAVVKHHDGYLLYQSRYNAQFSLAASPLEGGHGSVLRDLAASARRHGVRLGIYMSTADSYQEREGIFGNGSAPRPTPIPTLVPEDDRAGLVGRDPRYPAFTYPLDDYNAYLFNTLYETLTEYGDICEVWFDGAQGNTVHPQPYAFTHLYDMIAALQPRAVTAISGRDVRWVGNEDGVSRFNEWGPQAITWRADGAPSVVGGEMHADTGSAASLAAAAGVATEARWWPAEADSRLTSGWFWGPQKATAAPPAELLTRYVRSAGRNSTMLLNVPPDEDGQINDSCLAALAGFAAELRRAFSVNHALGAPARGGNAHLAALTDGRLDTGATVAIGEPVELELATPTAVDSVAVRELVHRDGQQIEAFTLDAWTGGGWRHVEFATEEGGCVLDGGAVGFRKILRLAQRVTAARWRLTVTAARGPVGLAELALHETLQADPGPRLDYYVDPTTGAPGDGSKERPLHALAQLWDVRLAPGTTLHLRSGVDHEPAFVRGYGTAARPLTVTSWGTGTATVGGADLATHFAADAVRGVRVI